MIGQFFRKSCGEKSKYGAETFIFALYSHYMRQRLAIPSLLVLLSFLGACNSKELARLQSENDSLRAELESRYTVLASLKDVRGLLDSIDVSRNSLRSNLSEGTSYEEFSSRLKDINQFVKMSEEKINLIQTALKTAKHEASAYLMLVDALKSEVQIRVDEIVKLQQEVTHYQDENKGLQEKIKLKEDEVNDINVKISNKQQELLLLEARVEAMVKNFKVTEADAYYARARAVEEAAKRTKLAPGKKRDTYKEALELYKRSQSLGKEEAKADIARLEKKTK
jgi:chromosome segregation ATPase